LREKRSRKPNGDAQFALYLSLILAELRAIRRLLERALSATPERRKNITVFRSCSTLRAAVPSLPGNNGDGDFMSLLDEIEDL
jgi:hypothetical protein